MRKPASAIIAWTALILLSTGPAHAAAKTGTCQAELEKFCKDVQTGEGRVIKCLKDHDADLAPACRAYVNSLSLYTACLDDAARLCPGMQPGVGRTEKCLRSHQTDLSSACKDELRKIRR